MSYQSTWDLFREAILDAAHRVKDANPGAWNEVKVPGQKSRRFISLVAAECQRTVSAEIGCNLKRGGPDVSLDVLAMPNASGCEDATGTYPGLELRDIIAGAEGPSPSLIWGDATPATIAANVPGGWIKTGNVAPQPQPTPAPPYPGDDFFWHSLGDVLEADYRQAGQSLNAGSSVWFARVIWDYVTNKMTIEAAIAKHRNGPDGWRKVLGLPPV